MRLHFLITILILTILYVGCSGSNAVVTRVDESGNLFEKSSDTTGILVSDFDELNQPSGGTGMMGIFHGLINPDNLTGELTPLRNLSLDDALEIVDITNFLSIAPCSDCAKIMSVELDADGKLLAKIGIKHPFETGDPLKPVTGRNRGDLHVFNVEGTVIFDDSTLSYDFPSIGTTLGPAVLENADGYSPYLDIVLDDILATSATIHPYKLHFDDYTEGNYDPSNPTGFTSVTDPPPGGNLVMAMGSDYDIQDYVFNFPDDTSFDFIFAVGCTYAVSAATKLERFTPEYQVPQHNKKAASEVYAEVITNELKAGDSTSYADLVIKVLDINHGVTVGDALNEMKADSSVSEIEIEVSGLTSGAVSGSTTPTGGDGRDPANPLTFPVTIFNDLEADEGYYRGLVKVTDSYQTGLNESPLLDGQDGIERVGPVDNPLEGLFAIPEFATYTTFEIYVEIGNEPPVASFCGSSIEICSGSQFYLDASSSYDLEDDLASIPLNFEFDFDYDGVTFDIDHGPTTDPVVLTPTFTAPVTIAVRVTDSGLLTDIATMDVTIGDESFTPDTWTSDVTDGSSIQNVRYFHTKDNVEAATRGRAYGTESMAYGNCYNYLTFFTSTGNVYFTRSNDAGQTWDTPTTISTGVSGLQGCAIDAVDSEVFIVTAETVNSRVLLHKNTNSGEGTWDTYEVYDYQDGWYIHNIGVAVDPNNTNYINIALVRDESDNYNGFSYSYHLRNDQGGSGTWTEQSLYYDPHHFNGRQIDIGCNSDGTFYVAYLANQWVGVTRSDDHGVTWTPYTYSNSVYTGAWAAELDMCFDPLDPDTIYIAWTSVGINYLYHPSLKLAKSTNRANSFTVIQNQLEHQVNIDDLPRQPAITCDAAGKLYVAYSFESETNRGEFDIFMKASCNGGSSFSAETQLNTDDDGFDVDPELVLCPQGGVVVTWDENGYLGYDGTASENPSGKIVARHIN